MNARKDTGKKSVISTKGQTQKWTEFRSLDAFRCRQIEAGDLIRPWIAAGPFFRDVSHEVPGRSFFEDHSLDNGVDVFRGYLEAGEACLAIAPVEAFGERNVAILLFRAGVTGWMSHCYFEPDRFNETREQGNWIFARKRDGYVGIWSENGSEVGSRGQYAGRERICRHRENAWVVEAGRKEDWGSFQDFVRAIVKTDPLRKDGKIVYFSPSVGTIQMGWEGAILLNGEAVDTDYPLLDSTYGYSEYRSGKMLLRYGDEQVELAV